MSDGLDEGYSSVESKNGIYAIFAKIKGIEVVRNTNDNLSWIFCLLWGRMGLLWERPDFGLIFSQIFSFYTLQTCQEG